MSARTVEGAGLQLLTALLSSHADNDQLDDRQRFDEVVRSFLRIPGVWPMGDEIYEMLIAWAGADLTSAWGVTFAVAVGRYLEGTGICPIRCTHPIDEASAMCAQIRSGAHEHIYDAGTSFRGLEPREHWIRSRASTHVALAQAVRTHWRELEDAREAPSTLQAE